MSAKFERDFDRQQRLLPEVRQLLAQRLVFQSPFEEDAKHNTDFIVLASDDLRVSCRLRGYEYLRSYGDEFTIRSRRRSGVETELDKIVAGWGDYMFYGFADLGWDHLAAWTLCDLGAFREWYGEQPPRLERWNADGGSSFMVFRWDELPRQCVVAQWLPATRMSK